MSRLFLILLTAVMVQSVSFAADVPRATFYIQLIRGSNDPKPPVANAKLIGPKLTQRLNPIFKWTNYWEVKRETIELEPGKRVRKTLAPERDVELELAGEQQMVVRIYKEGKAVREVHQSTESRFIIAGGDKDSDQSWFVVVRKDNPPTQTASPTSTNATGEKSANR